MKFLFTSKQAFLLFGLLISSTMMLSAQSNIDIRNELTSGVTASPVQGGQTDVVLMGVELRKTGAETELDALTFTFNTDPSVRFSAARLYRVISGTPTLVSNGTISTTNIVFTPINNTDTGNGAYLTNFGGSTGTTDREFYIVVDIATTVTASTPSITASLASSGIAGSPIAPNVATVTYSGATIASEAYSFTPLEADFTQAADDGAGTADQNDLNLLAWSVNSNGSQNLISPLVVTFNVDVTNILENFDFRVGGSNVPGTEIYTLNGAGTQLTITGFDPIDVTAATNFVLQGDIRALARSSDDFTISLAPAGATVSAGYVESFTTYTNNLNVTGFMADFTQSADAGTAVTGSTGNNILAFNVNSNGIQSIVSPMVFTFNTDVTAILENFALQVGGSPIAGSPVYTLNGAGTQLTITGFSATDVTNSTDFSLLAGVKGTATSANDFIVSLAPSGIATNGGDVEAFAAFTNSVDVVAPEADFTQAADDATGLAAQAGVNLLSFSVNSNGVQNLTPNLVFTFSTDVTAILEGFDLRVGGVNIAGSEIYTLNGAGTQLTISAFTDVDVTNATNFSLLANIKPGVTSANDFTINLAAAGATVSPGTVEAFGTFSNSVDVSASTADFTQSADDGVAAATTQDVNLLAFNVNSNGIQSISTPLVLTFNVDVTNILENFDLRVNGVNIAGSETYTLNGAGTQLTIAAFTAVDVTNSTDFSLLADIKAGATSANDFTINLAAGGVAVDVGTVEAFGTFSNSVDVTALEIDFTQVAAAATASGGDDDVAILSFSANSNGTQSINTPLVFTFNTDVTNILENFDLQVNGVNIGGVETYTLNGAGTQLTVAAFTGVDVTNLTNFSLLADIKESATSASDFTATLANTGVTPSTGGVETFTFNNSVDVTALEADFTQNADAATAVGDESGVTLLSFNVNSNGTQSINTPLVFTFNTDVTNILENFDLRVNGVNVGGVELYNLSGAGTTLTVSAFTAIDVTNSTDISLHADIRPLVLSTNDFTVNLAAAGVTISPGVAEAFGTFSNTVDVTSLSADFTQNAATTTALGDQDDVNILAFNVNSNGTQSINSPLVFTFNTNVSAILENFDLQVGGVNVPGVEIYTLNIGGNQLTVTGFTAIDVTNSTDITLVADIRATATSASDFTVNIAPAGIAISAGFVEAFGTFSNSVDVTALEADFTQLADAATAVGDQDNLDLLSFSVNSNGTQSLSSPIVFNFSTDVTNILENFELLVNGVNIAGVELYTLNLGGTQLTVSGFTAVDVTNATTFTLQADIRSTVNSANDFTISMLPANVSITPGFKEAFGSFSNAIDITELLATILEVTGAPVTVLPLEAGSTNAVLAGFQVNTTGTQTLNSIAFTLTATAAKLSNFRLFSTTTPGIVGGLVATNASASFTGINATLNSGTTYYYYLVADVAANLTTTTAVANISTTDANIVFASGNKTALSINRNISFSQSAATTVAKVNASEETTYDLAEYNAHTATSALTVANTDNIVTIRITDNDTDNLNTDVTGVTLTLNHFASLATIAIFDDNDNRLAEVAAAASVNLVFSGPFAITDNTFEDLRIRTTFKATVIDKVAIQATITGVTVDNTKSRLAAFSSFVSDGALNVIDVDATEMRFNNVTASVSPSTPFGFTVNATDVNGNIDLDVNSTGTTEVQISRVAGGGTFSAGADTDTRSFVNGAVTWSTVTLSPAGTYTIRANHEGSLPDEDLVVIVESLGVDITGPANQAFCFQGAYQPLTNIVLTETDPADFGAGSNVTYSIILPGDFEFNTAVTPTISETSTNPDNITGFGAISYPAANIMRFTYSVTGTNEFDQITITGLQVKYTGLTTVSNLPILRLGGTASQVLNSETDGEPHGTLSAVQASTFSFTVDESPGQTAVDPSETRFSATSQPIILVADASFTGGVFSGPGVVKGSDNIYRFYPNLVGQGSNYVVTYTYTAPASPNCKSTATKTFEVYQSSIIGLAPQYCLNGSASGTLSVAGGFIPSGYVLQDFVYWNSGWFFLGGPTTTTFNPASFSSVVSVFGGVYVGYRIKLAAAADNPTASAYNWEFTRVFFPPNPTITNLADAYCGYDAQFTLVGSPAKKSNGFDEFFSSAVGAPLTPAPGVNSSTSEFNPASALGASVNPVQIQINYKYRDEGTSCTNQYAKVVTINPKPPKVLSSSAYIAAGTISPNKDLYFCQGSTITAFTVSGPAPTPGSVTYNWYSDAALTAPVKINSVNYAPSNLELNNNIVGISDFFVTRVVNGCQSDGEAVTIEIKQPADANAAITSVTICSNDVLSLISLSPTITGAVSTGTWSVVSTPGTGQFVDVNSNPNTAFGAAQNYVPSQAEKDAGEVVLRLSSALPSSVDANNNCPIDVVNISLRINPIPVVSAGPDIQACASDKIFLSGTTSGGASSSTWNKVSGGTVGGTYTPASLSTEYIPTAGELSTGATIVFSLTTDDPVGPCTAQSDNVQLIIQPKPTVSAGADFTICEGANLQLSNLAGAGFGATASSALWSLTAGPGTGDFQDNGNATNYAFGTAIKYIPSAGDIAFGAINIRLTTDDPAGPCDAQFDDVLVTINPGPIVDAGADFTVCAGDQIQLSGSRSGSANNTTWTENGQGSVDNPASLIARYNSIPGELATGAVVTMTLTSDDPDGPSGPCLAASDQVDVTINQRPEVNAGPDQVLCADEAINISATLIGSASSGSWSGGTGPSAFTNANNLATQYNLSGTEPNGGDIDLIFTTNDPDGTGSTGPCPAGTDVVRITVKAVPNSPTISPVPEYCVGGTINPLVANGAPGSTIRWYSDAGLTTNIGSGATGSDFSSGVSNTTATQRVFYATQVVNSCESNIPAAQATVIVNPLPVPNFTMSNFCLTVGEGVIFTDASQIAPGQTIEKWGWRFGDTDELIPGSGPIPDGTHQEKTKNTFQNPFHKYSAVSNYTVTLTAVSSKNCEASVQKTLRTGLVPEPDFTVDRICYEDVTRFVYTGSTPDLPGFNASYNWTFGDDASSSANFATGANVTHTFTDVNSYNVKLTVTTDLGCVGEITRKTSILPYNKGNSYGEDFEDAVIEGHGWVTQGVIINPQGDRESDFTSWQWGAPSGPTINAAASGGKAWYTRANTTTGYRNNERSVVYGPCVDMRMIPRPVLSVNYWSNSDSRNDGAYLEVSTDDGASWTPLGNLVGGKNWYNGDRIIGLSEAADIGQNLNQFGWTGDTKTATNTAGWTEGRINLDAIRSYPKVMFRFVFGSNGDNPTDRTLDGFAFDDFSIKTRNRTILVENFTNMSAPAATANNTGFRAFRSDLTGDELVRLQYHTSIGGTDAINEVNRIDPNARAAFYGVTAPLAGYVDGRYVGPFNTSTTASEIFGEQSLVVAPLQITINPPGTNPDTQLFRVTGAITVEGNTVIDPALEPFIHIALVDRAVGTEEFVLRKLLPNAAGQPLTALTSGQSQTFSVEDDLRFISDKTQMAVVVFVQSLKNGSLLQAAVSSNIPEPTVNTGVEDLAEGFNVYPLPADREMIVELPAGVTDGAKLRMFDQVGKVVTHMVFEKGERKKMIDTSSHAGGVYLMQIETAKGILSRKVMVLHER